MQHPLVSAAGPLNWNDYSKLFETLDENSVNAIADEEVSQNYCRMTAIAPELRSQFEKYFEVFRRLDGDDTAKICGYLAIKERISHPVELLKFLLEKGFLKNETVIEQLFSVC